MIYAVKGVQQPRKERKGKQEDAGGRELQPWDAGSELFDGDHAVQEEQAWGIQGDVNYIYVDTLVCEPIAKTTKVVFSVEEEYESVNSVKKDQMEKA